MQYVRPKLRSLRSAGADCVSGSSAAADVTCFDGGFVSDGGAACTDGSVANTGCGPGTVANPSACIATGNHAAFGSCITGTNPSGAFNGCETGTGPTG